MLELLVLLPGCVSVTSHRAGPGFSGPTPQRYANSLDSATQACLRNPAACYAAPGEEAILPWLARALNTLRTAAATLRLLEGAQVQQIEQVLFLCAKDAHLSINDQELGAPPTEAQCKEVVRREGNTDITRAMDLGSKKHARALECARKQLEGVFPDNVSIEPLYQKDVYTGLWRWVDPLQVAQWLSDGLFHLLRGTLVPDVVIHAAGDPNKVQRIYDLKFPCPAEKFGFWNVYHRGHPHHPRDQRQLYGELGGQEPPVIIHPIYGIQ
ncbi:MAG TPA: hypothetical protein VEY88_16495 [Archangium sp.]|nr:hypothetical protein [Archangium sp.]